MLQVLSNNGPMLPDELMAGLNDFLSDNPVIETKEQADIAAKWVTRIKITLATMEADKTELAAPLRSQLNEIYAAHREACQSIEAVRDLCLERLTAYGKEQEKIREAEATRLREEAENAKAAADQAAGAADNAMAMAELGATDDGAADVPVASAKMLAHAAERAERTATRAENAIPERFNIGGRSMQMRSPETLTVTDACAAITAMGLTPKIDEAIQSSARDWRRINRELPPGVTSNKERKL